MHLTTPHLLVSNIYIYIELREHQLIDTKEKFICTFQCINRQMLDEIISILQLN